MVMYTVEVVVLVRTDGCMAMEAEASSETAAVAVVSMEMEEEVVETGVEGCPHLLL